ncbi:hypothetical protein [Vibrio rumoiensis]|uniref:Calcium-binding protein n=1 Tax=Vibrio rumoiensis 1S-45 TaxID=1188252 RepID=A0A1E5E4V5_9VIBR|nr:hypothetical protein [Vibrio rumoiensis]OEF28159.1 hypothetical protein A1QC_05825 [Vibrio rumoiensis 1S-45]
MKRIAFIILVSLALWQFFYQPPPKTVADQKPKIAAFFDMGNTSTSKKRSPQQGFMCDERQRCSDMDSQKEAAYFYLHCPNQKLEVDPDGTPCGEFFE